MVKVTYDKEAKILSFRLSPKKSVDSDVQENVVIDRDKNGAIVNIEIMDVEMGEFRKAKSRIGKRTRFDLVESR